jgi:hypothetical protein
MSEIYDNDFGCDEFSGYGCGDCGQSNVKVNHSQRCEDCEDEYHKPMKPFLRIVPESEFQHINPKGDYALTGGKTYAEFVAGVMQEFEDNCRLYKAYYGNDVVINAHDIWGKELEEME